jgi:hypothetical protein
VTLLVLITSNVHPSLCSGCLYRPALTTGGGGGAGARQMWGQCHPLFAFPSPVEAHNLMTIQSSEQKWPMSSIRLNRDSSIVYMEISSSDRVGPC